MFGKIESARQNVIIFRSIKDNSYYRKALTKRITKISAPYVDEPRDLSELVSELVRKAVSD